MAVLWARIERGLVAFVGESLDEETADATPNRWWTRYRASVVSRTRTASSTVVHDIGAEILANSLSTRSTAIAGKGAPSCTTGRTPREGDTLNEAVVAGLRARGLPVETGVFSRIWRSRVKRMVPDAPDDTKKVF
jgi:D-Tyr-tRNAtyr deacylase